MFQGLYRHLGILIKRLKQVVFQVIASNPFSLQLQSHLHHTLIQALSIYDVHLILSGRSAALRSGGHLRGVALLLLDLCFELDHAVLVLLIEALVLESLLRFLG
jgi:hypothetical protein